MAVAAGFTGLWRFGGAGNNVDAAIPPAETKPMKAIVNRDAQWPLRRDAAESEHRAAARGDDVRWLGGGDQSAEETRGAEALGAGQLVGVPLPARCPADLGMRTEGVGEDESLGGGRWSGSGHGKLGRA